MICKNCNAEMNDDSKFCPVCGTQVEQTINDVNTDELALESQDNSESLEQPAQTIDLDEESFEAMPQDAVETEETQPLQAEEAADVQQEPPVSYQQNPYVAPSAFIPQTEIAPKKKNTKKFIIIGVIAAVLVAVAVALVVLFANKGGGKAEPPTVYFAETYNGYELVVVESLGKNEAKTFTVTEKATGNYMFSSNYKYIVYGESDDPDDDEFDIYCKKIGDEKDEGQLIVKNAEDIFYVQGEIDKIIYEKNNNVYAANIKGDSEKIAHYVKVNGVIDDGKYLFCTQYDTTDDYETIYTLQYIPTSGGDAITVSKSADQYEFDASDSKVYFTENGQLFCSNKDKGDKKESIAKDVVDFSVTNGNVYYTVTGQEFKYADFVNDTYKNADAGITEPQWEDYEPNIEDYQTEVYDDFWEEFMTETDYDAYDDAWDAARDKYYADCDKYDEAADRIYIREELQETAPVCTYSLYVFDGSNSKLLTESASSSSVHEISKLDYTPDYSRDSIGDYSYMYSSAVEATVYASSLSEVAKINIDEIDGIYDIDDYLDENVSLNDAIASTSGLITLDVSAKKLELEDIGYADGQYIIYCESIDDEYDDYNGMSVYTLASDAKSFDDAKLVAENVYAVTYFDGSCVTFTDYNSKSGAADMNVGDNTVNDVVPRAIMNQNGSSDFYYATDYNSKTGESTVYKYANGKTEKVAEDVIFGSFSFTVVDGKILALTDYDDYNESGTLICIDGEKRYEVADHVYGFINNSMRSLNIY